MLWECITGVDVLQWSDKWLMKLNLSKCKVLSLCTNKNNSISYVYGWAVQSTSNVVLGHVKTFKDLGVVMDSELQFTTHVYEKINLAYKMLGIIKRNFTGLGTVSFLILYKSFVRCHLEFEKLSVEPV